MSGGSLIFNPWCSGAEALGLDGEPAEVREQFLDLLNAVPLLRHMASPGRFRARDLDRDPDGRIIVDVTHPHILEDMDYFRPSALRFMETGSYTGLRPNPNPCSEFGRWLREETRRCWEGYVRESDGEWIPGYYYFFLNYSPIMRTQRVAGRGRMALRVRGFPSVWDGHYCKFHYIDQARKAGENGMELASRSKGKSLAAASMLARNFIIGESEEACENVASYITAEGKDKLVGGDQTLEKFKTIINHLAGTMQWPSGRVRDRESDMMWTMGLRLKGGGTEGTGTAGTGNSVTGKASQSDAAKLVGSRGVLYFFEEAGYFTRLGELWNNMMPCVREGSAVFGMLYAFGTSGDDLSDFAAMQEIMYHPDGYSVYGIPNVYDREGLGRKTFSFFFPAYMDLEGYYDSDGNSDVTGALLSLLRERHRIRMNTADPKALSRFVSHNPVTPQEAVLRTRSNLFPVADITARIAQIDSDPHFFDDVYVGALVFRGSGLVFTPTDDTPIRDFPLKDSAHPGAVEIYAMPQKDSSGKITYGRYIASLDPTDDDYAPNSVSLCSAFVLDLFTDSIVAEWTGRNSLADDNFETVRRLCLFYNARLMYENNRKGCYAYFMRMGSLWLLAETPQYLRDLNIVKETGTGNKGCGIGATLPINRYADKLTQQWLISPVEIPAKDAEGNDTTVTVQRLSTVRNRAFLKECTFYSPDVNVDRIRSFGMLMLYREQFWVESGGRPAERKTASGDGGADDDFFRRNWDDRGFGKKGGYGF